MDTEYYKFYERKKDLVFITLLFLLFVCVSCASLSFLAMETSVTAHEQIIKIFLILCFFISLSVFVLKKLFSKKTYIEATPSYIKIGDSEQLSWTDISQAKAKIIPSPYGGVPILALEVKDISKYKLTINQKLLMKAGYPAFFINYAILKKEDLSELGNLLKKYLKTE